MLIDCTTCIARDVACGDCVITVLLATPPPATRPAQVPDDPLDTLDLDDTDRAAIDSLARAGLVPPLRLVAPLAGRDCGDHEDSTTAHVSEKGRDIA